MIHRSYAEPPDSPLWAQIPIPFKRTSEEFDDFPYCIQCGDLFNGTENPHHCPECKILLCEDCSIKHKSELCDICEEERLEKEKTASKAA